MATSRQLTGIGILAACFFVIGCTTFTSSSINTVTDRQSVSGHRSSRPKLGNPFRRPSAIDREGLGLIGSATTFHWNTVATTASGEPLQVNSAGDGGFRSLVVGSVGGDDAIALKLTEDLAHYLHHNRLIIGGLNAIVLRTLNPDGMKLGRHENSDGVYINNLFPKSDLTLLPTEASQLPKEVQFLIGLVSAHRPQRLVHIRTVQGSRGLLAVSHGAMDSGREIADWLDFTLRDLSKDVRNGTLESWAARRGDCDVITIGIPRQTEADEVWTLFGDAVLSLLLDGDSESRRIAREQEQQRSANRRHAWDETTDEPPTDMFQESRLNDVDASVDSDGSQLE